MSKGYELPLDSPAAREAHAKLQEAAAEIEDVIARHDIGAFFVLHAAPNQIEVRTKFEPSYSILRELEPGVFRMRAKLQEDYDGDEALQVRDIGATANMLHGFAEVMLQNGTILMRLHGALSTQVDIKHGPLKRL